MFKLWCEWVTRKIHGKVSTQSERNRFFELKCTWPLLGRLRLRDTIDFQSQFFVFVYVFVFVFHFKLSIAILTPVFKKNFHKILKQERVFLTKTHIKRHFELFWLLWQKCRPLYHPPDIWTEDNSATKGTEGNLMRQTGNNTFNLSFYTEINCQTDQNRAG